MPITLLWAVDVYGRVYSLSTAGQRWVRADDMLLELKRVTAGKGRCWGIGCDHHIYLNIMPSETSIRYREETYENQVREKTEHGGFISIMLHFRVFLCVHCQRWNPVDGFTDVLLPTDRWPWSDITGMNPQPLHSFQLPSRSWEWEGDWYVDQSCGEPSQTGCEFRGQLTEASQGSAPSGTDSDSELGPTNSEHSAAPVLEAAASSIVPLGGTDTSAPPQEVNEPSSGPQQDAPKAFIPASDSFINSLVSDRDKTTSTQPSITEMPQEGSVDLPPAPVLPTLPAAGHDIPFMNVDLEGAEATRGAQVAGRSLSDVLGTLENSQGIGEEDGPVWTWVSGGGCDVDASSQISWLSPTGIWTNSFLGYIMVG
ncbi:hypothetical protein XENOCAPTIV_021852 [Xenoophorus captivus]|uniref:Peroxin/Ferlin domain-containing protein n=1 Tax=Xenoophorus captivus TaxID=1517983 RepID=A0ABV0QE04_9TELE